MILCILCVCGGGGGGGGGGWVGGGGKICIQVTFPTVLSQ